MHVLLKAILFILFFPFSLVWLMFASERNTSYAKWTIVFLIKALLVVSFFPLSLIYVGYVLTKMNQRRKGLIS